MVCFCSCVAWCVWLFISCCVGLCVGWCVSWCVGWCNGWCVGSCVGWCVGGSVSWCVICQICQVDLKLHDLIYSCRTLKSASYHPCLPTSVKTFDFHKVFTPRWSPGWQLVGTLFVTLPSIDGHKIEIQLSLKIEMELDCLSFCIVRKSVDLFLIVSIWVDYRGLPYIVSNSTLWKFPLLCHEVKLINCFKEQRG